MSFGLSFDCPLFTLELTTDADMSPDVLDTALSRFSRSVAESLAQVAPHAGVILGDSDDDE